MHAIAVEAKAKQPAVHGLLGTALHGSRLGWCMDDGCVDAIAHDPVAPSKLLQLELPLIAIDARRALPPPINDVCSRGHPSHTMDPYRLPPPFSPVWPHTHCIKIGRLSMFMEIFLHRIIDMVFYIVCDMCYIKGWVHYALDGAVAGTKVCTLLT